MNCSKKSDSWKEDVVMEKELVLIEKVFQGKQIRTIWNVDEEKFYISVIDIIDVLYQDVFHTTF